MSSSLVHVPSAPDHNYDERMRWRKKLNESLCRELAAEYMRGIKDQCNADAYDEFVERYGDPSLPPSMQVRKTHGKTKNRRR